jgi:hypothetical protein
MLLNVVPGFNLQRGPLENPQTAKQQNHRGHGDVLIRDVCRSNRLLNAVLGRRQRIEGVLGEVLHSWPACSSTHLAGDTRALLRKFPALVKTLDALYSTKMQ